MARGCTALLCCSRLCCVLSRVRSLRFLSGFLVSLPMLCESFVTLSQREVSIFHEAAN
nr:MAG TPA: hypothetical protein [Caudoviricetes sp.]